MESPTSPTIRFPSRRLSRQSLDELVLPVDSYDCVAPENDSSAVATNVSYDKLTAELPQFSDLNESNIPSRLPGNVEMRKRFQGAGAFRRMSQAIVTARKVGNHTLHSTHHSSELIRQEPGAAPGIDTENEAHAKKYEHIQSEVRITVIDYNASYIQIKRDINNLTIAEFLQQSRPSWSKVRWINCEGLSWDVLKALANHYKLHPLAIEDVLHVPQKIKIDRYEDHIYLSLTLLSLDEPSTAALSSSTADARFQTALSPNRTTNIEAWSNKYTVNVEQTSVFLLKDGTLMSFFHQQGNIVTKPLMSRLQQQSLLIRRSEDASFLMNAVIDTIVDHTIPVIEYYSSEISRLEAVMLEYPEIKYTKYLHILQGELSLLRRTLIPTKLILHNLRNPDNDQGQFITALTRTYLNDVQDHADTVVDNIDALVSWAKDLIDLTFNTIAYETNKSMKTLAVLSAGFLPITFIAGVYGTNFDVLPELRLRYGYLYFWIGCIAVFVVVLGYCKKINWW